GYVGCTVRHEGLAHDKLLMVEMLNARGEPDGQWAVAVDSIGAGGGEWVLLASGRPAGQAHAHGASPVGLCGDGIVEEAAPAGP
ncbi:ethanolamine utilization microcompartment protein EutN, partial [Klebsiella pneumoniae]|uniref:ethanolamine utilization microcompartment protein EutN n=1 Tax=Klebsiella pneumoniae TaxID=573 RepID=UPI003134AD11